MAPRPILKRANNKKSGVDQPKTLRSGSFYRGTWLPLDDDKPLHKFLEVVDKPTFNMEKWWFWTSRVIPTQTRHYMKPSNILQVIRCEVRCEFGPPFFCRASVYCGSKHLLRYLEDWKGKSLVSTHSKKCLI